MTSHSRTRTVLEVAPHSAQQAENRLILSSNIATEPAPKYGVVNSQSKQATIMNMITDDNIRLMGRDDPLIPPMPNGKSGQEGTTKAKRAWVSCTNCRQSKASDSYPQAKQVQGGQLNSLR